MSMNSAARSETRLAAACTAALERGDAESAQQLAEQGLALAQAAASAPWVRRFKHLLRAATGGSIEDPPSVPSSCGLCLGTLGKGRKLNAGTNAFVCDECVRRCSTRDVDGSPLQQLFNSQVPCSFCGRIPVNESVYAANGHSICDPCVERVLAMIDGV